MNLNQNIIAATQTGFFGPGECVDQAIVGIRDVLAHATEAYNTAAFVNPQMGMITGLTTGSIDCRTVFTAYVNNPLIQNPADGPFLTACATEWDKLDTYYMTLGSPGGHYGMWTNWLSGKETMFPIAGVNAIPGMTSGLGHPITNTAGLGILAATGFAGMLGLVSGMTRSAYVTCEVDPAHPCATALGMFGSVMNAFNSVLNTILNGFALMTNFYGKVEEWMNKLIGYAQQFFDWIANEINAGINALLKLIQHGMAKLMKALGINDPCLNYLMRQICSTELKVAIGLPTLPSIPSLPIITS